MNFTVVSLLSLLSFTSLVTSPAICMSSDSEDDSPTSSPRAPRAKSTKLPADLDLDSLVGAYDHLRGLGNGAPDTDLIAYIAAKSWGTMDLDQQEKVITHVKRNSKTSEAFALTSLVSKYDAVKPINSTPDKELIAYLAGTSWPTDADEQVDLVARVLAASTLAPKIPTTAAAADPTDATATATSTPTKVAKAPLDAGIMAEIAGYAPVLSNIGDLTEGRKFRTQAAIKAGVTRELADHLNCMRALLPHMITLDPAFIINTFKEAETFVGHHSKLNAFATAAAGAKITLPNGVKPSDLLIEAATLIQNIVEQNPGDVDARTLHATFRTVLIDQGDCQLPALSGRLAYVYDLAFKYLVEKYNAD